MTDRPPPVVGHHRVHLVDILIMFVLLAVALLMWRAANRNVVIGLWVVCLVLMIGLFRYHVTSALELSF